MGEKVVTALSEQLKSMQRVEKTGFVSEERPRTILQRKNR